MPFRLATGAAFVALLMIPSSGSAQVLMQRDVSVRMALTIAEAALAACGVNTSVAVVDRAGRLVPAAILGTARHVRAPSATSGRSSGATTPPRSARAAACATTF